MIVLRSLIFMVLFYLGTTILALLLVPTFLMPRGAIAGGIRLWGWWIRWLVRVVCGIKVEVRGLEHLPDGPALIAAKHQSMFDVFCAFTLLPDACFVMKKELIATPLIGWYSLKVGMVVVDREGHAAALKKLVADTQDRMKHDRQVVIFPEGTRTTPGAPGQYKPGIAALYRDLGLPCTPLATNSGVHWQSKGFLRRPGTVVFEFLEPIPAGLKRGQFMTELETRIETASNALIVAKN